MIQLKNLSEAAINKIRNYRYDRIIEKHEGPEHWSSILDYYDPEFLTIEGKPVLLPIDPDHHKNITILRTVIDRNETTLTVFLKDTTYVSKPEYEYFEAGFIVVCDKIPGEEFFIAVLYHEWFIIEEQILNRNPDYG